MRKSLNLLAAASLLAALGACSRQDRAASDGEGQPNRLAPEDERQLNKAVGDFHDLSNEMRNDAANVPGAAPDQVNVTQ